MSGQVAAVLVAATCCALAGSVAPTVIGRLREPTVEATGPPRPSYRELSQVRHLGLALGALGAAAGAVVGWRLGWSPLLPVWTYLTGVCLVLGYVDSRTRLLPTQIIAPSYLVVLGLLLAAALVDRQLATVTHAFLGWLFMGGFYLVMWRLGPRGLGYGDVRLSGLLALCLGALGWAELVTGLYAGFLLGGAASLLLLVLRRVQWSTAVPFGPYMMLGGLVGLVWGHPLSDWYLTR